jgi:Uma2 family endonuclease
MSDLATPTDVLQPVRRHKLSVEDFHKLGEAGVLHEDSRVELIEGELIDMAPIGSPHAGTVNRLVSLVSGAVTTEVVHVQNPITLDDYSEPQPDLAVLKPRADFYRSVLPTASDVLLLIEVSDTTLAYDRGPKLELYSRHGILEVWIVNLPDGQLEVFRDPSPEGYRERAQYGSGDFVSAVALPELAVEVATLF